MNIDEVDNELRKAKAKPCPFCGYSHPNVSCTVFINDLDEYECESAKVKCPVCGCTIEGEINETDVEFLSNALTGVVKSWNKRKKPVERKKTAPDELPF